MTTTKVYNKKIEFTYFKVYNQDTQSWYARAIQHSLVDKTLGKWNRAGREWEEITKQEYDNWYRNID